MLVKAPAPTWGHQRAVAEIHLALHAVVGPDRVVESPIDFPVDEPTCQVHSLSSGRSSSGHQ